MTVAVIDTGYVAHTRPRRRTSSPGYDFISDTAVPVDGNGRDTNPADPGDWTHAGECGTGQRQQLEGSSWHGTHVAGTIAAVTNNAKGVAGIAYNAKILPVRVLGKCGGYTSDIADAIIWASGGTVSGVPANANPAKVINMSPRRLRRLLHHHQNAINAARRRGTTVVVAAGNEQRQRLELHPGQLQQRDHRRRDRPHRRPGLLLQLRRQRRHRGARRRDPSRHRHPRHHHHAGERHPLHAELRRHHAGAPRSTSPTRAPAWPPRTSRASRAADGDEALAHPGPGRGRHQERTPARCPVPAPVAAARASPTPTKTVHAVEHGPGAALRRRLHQHHRRRHPGQRLRRESSITVSGRTGNAPSALKVGVDIIHTYRGDLVINLVAPGRHDLPAEGLQHLGHHRQREQTYTVNASSEVANGTWKLRVQDVASRTPARSTAGSSPSDLVAEWPSGRVGDTTRRWMNRRCDRSGRVGRRGWTPAGPSSCVSPALVTRPSGR